MTAAPPIVGTETYISFADADAIAADRLNAAEWRAAVAAHDASDGTVPVECRRALITATATLDRMPWEGSPTANGIPAALAIACAELAFHLLTPEDQPRRNVQMSMVGQSMETYFPEVADELPMHVRRLIEPFLRVRSKHSAELVP